MKSSTRVFIKILIGILAALAIMLTCLLVFALTTRNAFFFGGFQRSDNVAVDEIYETQFETVKVNSSAGKIVVRRASDDETSVKVYSEDRVDVKVFDEPEARLELSSDTEKCNFFCFNIAMSVIEIELPADFSGMLEVHNNYGDIEIEDFAKAKMKIDSDCGNVEVEGVGTLEAELNLGNLEIGRVTEKLQAQNHCGNLEVDSLEATENSSVKMSLGNVEIHNTAGLYVDAKTDLGRVDVDNNHRDANVTLSVENSCGNITVKE